MYKNILIPIDFDHEEGIRSTFAAARLLADENAKFTVMHIVEPIPGYVRGQIGDDILEQRSTEMKQSLEKIASDLPGAVALLETGHAGHSIVNYADENDIDCIVLSSHTPKLEKFFLGSTATRVVNHAGCTVLVIR
jgi:universal stress protein F